LDTLYKNILEWIARFVSGSICKIERARCRKKWDTIVKTFNNYILDEDEHDIKNYPDLNLWLRQITLTGVDIMRNPNSIIVLLCNYDDIIMHMLWKKKTLSGVSLKNHITNR
jgi:hypothetical protein